MTVCHELRETFNLKPETCISMTILQGYICTTLASFSPMDALLHMLVGIIWIHPSNAVSDYSCVPKPLFRMVCLFP
jgi:hypothetical protein